MCSVCGTQHVGRRSEALPWATPESRAPAPTAPHSCGHGGAQRLARHPTLSLSNTAMPQRRNKHGYGTRHAHAMNGGPACLACCEPRQVLPHAHNTPTRRHIDGNTCLTPQATTRTCSHNTTGEAAVRELPVHAITTRRGRGAVAPPLTPARSPRRRASRGTRRAVWWPQAGGASW